MEDKLFLKKIGFFKEMELGDEKNPSIKDFIYKNKDNNIKEKLYEYLKSGIVIVACFGINKDIFDENKVAGNNSLLSDGKYVWTDDLAYYVKEYNLELEESFINYLLNNSWNNSFSEQNLKNKHIYIDNIKIY